ncbi:hypothetical protein Poli38472_010033 [Pythium oligandrum]|uniref:protein-serine/threonine phosphatase n=1 Tax=Pythium oligandrum TaxID=41045 RepID=A0A8K1C8L6_PYTOL|nr:hypothetical protein Poli38472_010033 [Pythium oligandrum]|eukprot:TMW58474.1 hypothetical protein Poli38472_010033 [Pythium oligandrum]
MSLLSCARKHRSLLWYRHHRAMMRRHALAAAASTSSTSKKKAGTLTLLLPVATASTPTPSPAIQASKPREISSTSSTSAKTAAMELHDDTRAVPVEESASSPWRALFLTFFAMIQPEKIKQPLAVDTEFLDDLHVNPVPPNVSDVVEHPEHLIWRYDMDSYAANSHNEDRSQYILDSIALECEESPEHDGPEVSMPVFFCGCYDGHGGEQAVEFVQRNLYRNIKNHMRRHVGSVTDAIISGFQETDQEFHRRSLLEFERGEWSACSVGACAVIAMIVDTKLYVASCGDCRAIMAYREPNGSLSVEQITWDHSANDEREQERLKLLYPDDYDIVREIGAHNYYVKGRLQPTRSLGDTYMKVQDVNRAPMPRGLRIRGSFKRPYITAIPDVFEVDLNERHPEFLVLGSDGLYGELSNQEIAQMVDKFRVQGVENVSQALRASVLERIAEYYGFSKKELEQISPGERRNYHDDITIDVVHFAPPPSLSQDEPVAA